METITTLQTVNYLEKIRGRTRGVIKCIPPDKIEWAHKEGRFTFGDLIRHIAVIERYMYAEAVQGKENRYTGHGRDLADGYDKVIALMDRLHAESIEIFSSLSDEALTKKCVTPAGAPITIWKWLRALAEHEVHHRGQIYTMLGILDLPVPPLFGLTAEQARVDNAGG